MQHDTGKTRWPSQEAVTTQAAGGGGALSPPVLREVVKITWLLSSFSPRLCTRWFYQGRLVSSSPPPLEEGAILIPPSQMGKLKLGT